MPLQKQPVNINFNQGLDTKSDPKAVQAGKFLELQNQVFDKAGALVKRNGFPRLTALPNAKQTTLTTLKDNLIATGSNLYAYSQTTDQWLNQGIVQPVSLNTQALVRSSTNQISPDVAVTAKGLICLAYTDNNTSYYQISDSNTGQQIVPRAALKATSINPRVFILANYFIITYMATIGGIPHFQFVAIPINSPASPLPAVDISTTVQSLNTGYDAVVANNRLYTSFSSTGGNITSKYISANLTVNANHIIFGATAALMSLTADVPTRDTPLPIIWLTYWNSSTNNASTVVFDKDLTVIQAPVQTITNQVLSTLTMVVTGGYMTLLYEVVNTYFYSTVRSDYIAKVTMQMGSSPSASTVVLRSVGLSSKAFLDDSGLIYVLITFGEVNQETYFLVDSSGNIILRLAPTNGGGYNTTQVLPNIFKIGSTYYVPYLIKDFLAAINKGVNLTPGTQTNAIYTQTGVNLALFSINTSGQYSSEISETLYLTGGQLWQYDSVRPTELGFHVYPSNLGITSVTAGGLVTAGIYYYAAVYEWTDNQGNLHRSAPSIPQTITTTGATSSNTIKVPTLRLTYKIAPNPVRIVLYRWSVAQQSFYQITSILNPVLNDTTIDFVTITDNFNDNQIIGQTLLYTTGGVIENIAPPASTSTALFKNRLFMVTAENRNLLWYSKVVIQNTPVEMSDLFTIYVAPTSGAQGSTGPITALSAMDDKLIIFKKDAIYYVTGTGPDNTGAQNDFSDPIFITSAVGCANQNSVVLTSTGIMFQSDKGIWILDRSLQTTYIGSPVERYNTQVVMKAQVIPATNQVRFVLDNRITLMYDYFYQQWGTFNNISAISATLYQGKDTYMSNLGTVYQEKDGSYLDGSSPVLLSFTTSWISLAGIQGLERFYELYILGTYITPFKLQVQIAYDYNPSATQSTVVMPDNYNPAWGKEALWGSSDTWGGPGNVFQARVFPQQQKCETFQLIVTEVYDPTFGIPAGEGLNLSQISAIIGVKRGYRANKAGQSFG